MQDLAVDPLYVSSSNLHLQASSPCLNTGTSDTGTYPDLPLIDFDGITRPQGSSYEMGAFEFQETPTCWEFVAKYLGSNKLFKMNGPGLFPKELKLPRNVDRRSARMIDEGKLIDPSQYKLL